MTSDTPSLRSSGIEIQELYSRLLNLALPERLPQAFQLRRSQGGSTCLLAATAVYSFDSRSVCLSTQFTVHRYLGNIWRQRRNDVRSIGSLPQRRRAAGIFSGADGAKINGKE